MSVITIGILGKADSVWGENPIIDILINGSRLQGLSEVIGTLIDFDSLHAKRFVTLKPTNCHLVKHL